MMDRYQNYTYRGGFDNMSTKEKTMEQIEKELREEIRSLAKQGKIYLFEEAMTNAMDKFSKLVKNCTEEELECYCKEESSKKKLPKMRKTDKS